MSNIQELRLIIFISILGLLQILELSRPENRQRKKNKTTNLLLLGASIVLMKIAFPFGIAALGEKFIAQDMTLFSFYKLPLFLEIPLSIIVFDFAIYWQHRLSHTVPILWRFHKVHHADQSMNSTTGVRFHPGEILISSVFKAFLLFIFAPRIETFIIYEIILNSMSLFNHSNIKLSLTFDSFLKKIIATPSFHTPHHSPLKEYTNSNYANFLVFWDRIFKTETKITNEIFGLEEIKEKKARSFIDQIALPFN